MRTLLSSVAAAATLTLAVGLSACGDTTGPEGATTVAFRAATDGGSAAAGASDLAHSHAPGDPALTLSGTNGVLTLASVHFIVAEFELERAENEEGGEDSEGEETDACDAAAGDDACEEFEAPLDFLELPLSGEDAVAVRQAVPAGSYEELEFSIEDLDDDEEDDDLAEIQALLAEIRDRFPDWPADGSLRIHGTFTPKDESGELLTGQTRDFTVFFEAEVEIEKEFATPLEVAGGQNPSVTVTVDPRVWFRRADGTVLDLSAFDFDPAAGEPVPELEVEIESEVDEAFREIEIEG